MGALCTSSTQSSTAIPEWLSGPASQTISRSVTESERPFTPYTDPLVAGISPTQQWGIDAIRAQQGDWTGQFGAAQDSLRRADGMSSMGAAEGNLDRADSMSALGAGGGWIQQGALTSSATAANPYIAAGAGAGGLQTASPFLSAAAQTAPGAISSYMSPYKTGVVDEIARLGSRNLTENILPKISDTFIGSGQFGSDRNAAAIGRAIRDTSADIAGKQAESLERGYGTAGSLFTADANRQAQLAGTAGNLGESASGRQLTAGNLLGTLTNADANRQIQAGTALGQLGDMDRDAALASATARAQITDLDRQGALASSRQGASLSGQQQQQSLADANALLAGGALEQQTQQRQYDSAFQQFMRQQNFSRDQLSWLNSIIRGTPSGQTTTQTTQQPLLNFLFKDGGRVRKPAQDYSPLTAYGRRKLADGGYLDEDEEVFPVDDDTLDGISLGGATRIGPYVEPERSDDDYRGIPGARSLPGDERDPKVQLLSSNISPLGLWDPENPQRARMAAASASPEATRLREAGEAARLTMSGKPPSALTMLRDRVSRSADDSEIKDAMAAVDKAQAGALAPRAPREESWMESPLAVGAAGFLAAPKGTGLLSRVGHGALEAVNRRQTQRRLDAQDERTTRMEALKVAQQRLSNLINLRNADTRTIGDLARAEAVAARAGAPKMTTMQSDAAAMGFDLGTERGRQAFAQFRKSLTRDPKGQDYAPLDIEKAQRIIDNPNTSPELKDAARRIIGAKGNRELTPAQAANLRATAAKLAQADIAGLGKDFQFKTPEEQQAFLQDRTDKHLAWLRSGAEPDGAPALEPPAAARPAPAAPAAPAPASNGGDPLAQATPEELQRIATDPDYPADPAMREAAKARLAAAAPPASPPAAPPTTPPAKLPAAPPGMRLRDTPAKMQDAMSENMNSLRKIEDALAALDEYPDAVGMKAGALNMLPGPALDAADPKGTKARALIADIGSLKIHDRSGAAVTAAEFPRLKPFVPNVYDSPETVRTKLANFKREYAEILKDQYAANGPSAGYKRNERVEEMLSGKKADRETKPQEGDTATNPKTGGRKVFRGGKWVDLK